MTKDEAALAVEGAQQAAYNAARNLLPPSYSSKSSDVAHIVNAARLRVIELTLANFMALNSEYTTEDLVTRALLELRDYWQEVAEEVRP